MEMPSRWPRRRLPHMPRRPTRPRRRARRARRLQVVRAIWGCRMSYAPAKAGPSLCSSTHDEHEEADEDPHGACAVLFRTLRGTAFACFATLHVRDPSTFGNLPRALARLRVVVKPALGAPHQRQMMITRVVKHDLARTFSPRPDPRPRSTRRRPARLQSRA